MLNIFIGVHVLVLGNPSIWPCMVYTRGIPNIIEVQKRHIYTYIYYMIIYDSRLDEMITPSQTK